MWNIDSLSFTPARVKQLRKQYDKAVAAGSKEFVFETGDPKHPRWPVLTAYAKYLLEYLEHPL